MVSYKNFFRFIKKFMNNIKIQIIFQKIVKKASEIRLIYLYFNQHTLANYLFSLIYLLDGVY